MRAGEKASSDSKGSFFRTGFAILQYFTLSSRQVGYNERGKR